jgi:hypothetical protein
MSAIGPSQGTSVTHAAGALAGKHKAIFGFVIGVIVASPIHHFPRQGVQHRHCLLASVQITSYNSHLGLLRSEHCWGEHRTVYPGRREAGVVMTSIRSWPRDLARIMTSRQVLNPLD